jgi:hypothetical protein
MGSAALTPHPRTARARRLRLAAAATLGLIVVLAVVHLLWDLPAFWTGVTSMVAVVLSGWAFWTALDAYASLGHMLDGRYLVTRRGSVRRSTVHLRRSGIIGWRIKQSIFQRRLGLVTVDATTAAATTPRSTPASTRAWTSPRPPCPDCWNRSWFRGMRAQRSSKRNRRPRANPATTRPASTPNPDHGLPTGVTYRPAALAPPVTALVVLGATTAGPRRGALRTVTPRPVMTSSGTARP